MSTRGSLNVLGVLSLVALAGAVASARPGTTTSGSSGDRFADMPSTLSLTAVVRDFRCSNQTNGHADFERTPSSGFGQYMAQADDVLDADGLPKFKSTGYLLSRNWTDSQGRNIINTKSYINAKTGDKAGALASSVGGSTTTEANFKQWYRDVAGTNSSATLSMALNRQTGTNRYVFDSDNDQPWKDRGGFFPIDGQLYGNLSGWTHNFGFTTMIDTQFTYEKGAGHVFTFTGDDDVWVYIDGKLVIDLGGVHSRVAQTIELDRLNWLQDAQVYSLKIFHAERHTSQSNFRIETTLNLRAVQPPSSSALSD